MSINSEIQRLKLAKNELFAAIVEKGGILTAEQHIDEYASAVNTIEINQSSSIDLTGVTVTADKLLNGIVAIDVSGNKVTGNIPAVELTRNGYTVSISKGYTTGGSVTIEIPDMPDIPVYPDAAVTVNNNVITITSGLIAAQEITIPESEITETENSVTIGIGYVGEEKTFEISSGSDISFGYINIEGKIQIYDLETAPPVLTEKPFAVQLYTLVQRPYELVVIDGDYLRFTAIEPSSVAVKARKYDSFGVLYRKSADQPWTRMENEVPVLLETGEYIELDGDYPGTKLFADVDGEETETLFFTMTGKLYGSGHLNSISQFSTTLQGIGYFALFRDCTSLVSSPVIPQMTAYFGNNIYYSTGTKHLVLNRETDTWENKTWYGFKRNCT